MKNKNKSSGMKKHLTNFFHYSRQLSIDDCPQMSQTMKKSEIKETT